MIKEYAIFNLRKILHIFQHDQQLSPTWSSFAVVSGRSPKKTFYLKAIVVAILIYIATHTLFDNVQ